MLANKILSILTDTPIQICSLYKVFTTQRKEVSSAISQLVLDGQAVTFLRKGRLMIVKQTVVERKISQTKSMKKCNGEVLTITPKIVPEHGDWVVRVKGESKVLYFNAEYDRNEVRNTMRKIVKCDPALIRTSHYKKIKSFREANNF